MYGGRREWEKLEGEWGGGGKGETDQEREGVKRGRVGSGGWERGEGSRRKGCSCIKSVGEIGGKQREKVCGGLEEEVWACRGQVSSRNKLDLYLGGESANGAWYTLCVSIIRTHHIIALIVALLVQG